VSSQKILVTGGAGFIGSHACVALIESGFEPIILDNFSNSDRRVINRVGTITGVEPRLIEGDVRDSPLLEKIFKKYRLSGVLHFAGLKSVAESVKSPLDYYDVNVMGTIALIQAMHSANVRNLIFSSSATVYGAPSRLPIAETAPYCPESPYGRSKMMVEKVLGDLFLADSRWGIACLRYFNPVGAHPSGLIGENPMGKPNNLMPFVAQVAAGLRCDLLVHGDDYSTIDGTGVRDYVHVVDLAEGHVAALRHVLSGSAFTTLNLGTGQGLSVLQVIREFEQVSNRKIHFRIGPRRNGDVAAYWADVALAEQVLNWRARRGLKEMCADIWRWQITNPNGYGKYPADSQ
jgi:UDP-glucose 4-epimerase